jgi:hypothetical protein
VGGYILTMYIPLALYQAHYTFIFTLCDDFAHIFKKTKGGII